MQITKDKDLWKYLNASVSLQGTECWDKTLSIMIKQATIENWKKKQQKTKTNKQ